jgi:hypothetical protein
MLSVLSLLALSKDRLAAQPPLCSKGAKMRHFGPNQGFLERFPTRWIHLVEKKSLQI